MLHCARPHKAEYNTVLAPKTLLPKRQDLTGTCNQQAVGKRKQTQVFSIDEPLEFSIIFFIFSVIMVRFISGLN